MKFPMPSSVQKHFKLAVILCFAVFSAAYATNDSLQFKTDKLTIDFGGKCNHETFFSNNMNFLNSHAAIDSISFMRTTFDFFTLFKQGDYEHPRIVFYDTLRFRFKWGSTTDVRNEDSFVTAGNSRLIIKGTTTNKHLLWMRESWLKIMLGELGEQKNFIQLGLIQYQVGRGISLGAAYDAQGFLGFVPGSSIDQYAPAFLLSFNPIKDRWTSDFYAALVENKQTSLTENLESIRKNELNACDIRGVGRQSFIIALRNEVYIINNENEKMTFEPYLVHQHAPDQDLESPFTNDIDTYLSTAGAAIEGMNDTFNWGIEGGCNFGEVDIKAWDRNTTKIAKDDNGFLIEQYTKILLDNPATTVKPRVATNTKDIAAVVAGSPKDKSLNGKEIGTVNGGTQPIYNAFDRIRPAQQKILSGYFFVADAAYELMPKVLNMALGVGYASGNIDQQQDVNKMTQQELMNQKFTGFLPLQSVYSGKRLRHLVIFNQGVPRFNVKLPGADLSRKNTIALFQPDTINEMTNIAFIGTRFDWKIPSFKKYKANIAQNIIAYWAPETAHVNTSDLDADGNYKTPITTEHSHNFLGTEFTTEFSAIFYEKIKIAGYFGAILPGKHYKDLRGTVIAKYNQKTCDDIGYVGNIGVAYFF